MLAMHLVPENRKNEKVDCQNWEVKPDDAIMDGLVGEYEMNPEFTFSVSGVKSNVEVRRKTGTSGEEAVKRPPLRDLAPSSTAPTR